MLKLGGYGIIRILNIFSKLNINIRIFFIRLSLIGRIYLCLLRLHQVDFKKLVAYSSVVHIGIFLGGVTTIKS
jgi:NADH:ubiquinone oxidoreductase subunit 4 (subunit M)